MYYRPPLEQPLCVRMHFDFREVELVGGIAVGKSRVDIRGAEVETPAVGTQVGMQLVVRC